MYVSPILKFLILCMLAFGKSSAILVARGWKHGVLLAWGEIVAMVVALTVINP